MWPVYVCAIFCPATNFPLLRQRTASRTRHVLQCIPRDTLLHAGGTYCKICSTAINRFFTAHELHLCSGSMDPPQTGEDGTGTDLHLGNNAAQVNTSRKEAAGDNEPGSQNVGAGHPLRSPETPRGQRTCRQSKEHSRQVPESCQDIAYASTSGQRPKIGENQKWKFSFFHTK